MELSIKIVMLWESVIWLIGISILGEPATFIFTV